MLRKNSRLRNTLGAAGLQFLKYSTWAIERILPHVRVSAWREESWKEPGSVWDSQQRTAIRMTLAIGEDGNPESRSLEATVHRRSVPGLGTAARRTLDDREYDICKLIAERISEVLSKGPSGNSDVSIRAIQNAFDEYVVAKHVQTFHKLAQMPASAVFAALHKLSEESYENKASNFRLHTRPRKDSKGGKRPIPRRVPPFKEVQSAFGWFPYRLPRRCRRQDPRLC
jgi:hypothetical protein